MTDSSAKLNDLGERLVATSLLRGDFLLSSGKRSDYYFDKYLFETKPDLLRDVTTELLNLVPDDAERLAGPELGAVPLVACMALVGSLPYVIVRRKPKAYGTGRHFEGRITAGDRVVLVEDVITSGNQALTAADHLRDFGAQLDVVICVLDREEGAAPKFAARDLELRPLFTSASLGITT
jgi:orotate phosphoribosyltransferase